MTVIVVGAGLAGLTCARKLQDAGRDVTVLEAGDGPGGRVRSDKVGGFTLDRGFQVLFDSYPAVRRNLDLEALKLSHFASGAIVCRDGKRTVLTDPRRAFDLSGLAETILTGEIPLSDKLRLLSLASKVSEHAGEDAEPSNLSIQKYLVAEGFSARTIDFFFRPFYGGILLDRSLGPSAGLFQYYYAMLSRGHACLPSGGIGAVTEQLARPLFGAGSIILGATVQSLIERSGRVEGVILEDDTQMIAESVVLAVDAPAAAAISGKQIETAGVGVSVVYLSGSDPLWKTPYLLLNANSSAVLNNAQMLTNVAPRPLR